MAATVKQSVQLFRTIRGVKSFRRGGFEFTREPREIPKGCSKARLKSIEDEPNLEMVSDK